MSKIINSCTLKIRGGVERDVYGKKAGKGALIQWEKSATLGVSQDQTLFVFKGGCNKPQCQWKRMENECQLYPECDRCTRNSV